MIFNVRTWSFLCVRLIHTEVGHTDSESAQHFWLGTTLINISCARDGVRISGHRIWSPTRYRLNHPVTATDLSCLYKCSRTPLFIQCIHSIVYINTSALPCLYMILSVCLFVYIGYHIFLTSRNKKRYSPICKGEHKTTSMLCIQMEQHLVCDCVPDPYVMSNMLCTVVWSSSHAVYKPKHTRG